MWRAAEEGDPAEVEPCRSKRQKSEEESRGVSFSILPTDVLLLVFARLTAADLIHAGAVCVSWRKALKSKGRLPPRTAIPWLMHRNDAEPTGCDLLDLNTGETYSIHLPGIDQECCKHVVGRSDDGFLVYEDLPSSRLSMINPITKATVLFPPLPSSREPCSQVLAVRTGTGYTVVVHSHRTLFLALADAGNSETWGSVSPILDDVCIYDFHACGKKLCGLFRQLEGNDVIDRVFTCDLSNPTDVRVCPFRLRCDSWTPADFGHSFSDGCRDDWVGGCPEGCCVTNHHPVVLPNGDMFVVCEAGSFVFSFPDTVTVYRMPTDLHGEGEPVTSIGSYALFLDDYGAVALSTQDSPELKPGTIYFGGSNHLVGDAPPGYGIDKRLVVFDMEDQFSAISVENYDGYRILSWFVPVF